MVPIIRRTPARHQSRGDAHGFHRPRRCRATIYAAVPLALALAGGCILEEPAALDLEAEAALDRALQDQENPGFTAQAICDANDLVSVNDFAGKHGITTRFVQREKIPVGKYFTGNGGECSGTLISHDLFLTASHCIPDAPPQITQGQVQFGFEVDGASDALPSRFWIPTMDEFNALGLSWPDVQPAPTVALSSLPLVPQNETLLKERSSDGVYVVRGGYLYGIPSWESFLAHGFHANRIRTVPNGSLNQIPYGGALP